MNLPTKWGPISEFKYLLIVDWPQLPAGKIFFYGQSFTSHVWSEFVEIFTLAVYFSKLWCGAVSALLPKTEKEKKHDKRFFVPFNPRPELWLIGTLLVGVTRKTTSEQENKKNGTLHPGSTFELGAFWSHMSALSLTRGLFFARRSKKLSSPPNWSNFTKQKKIFWKTISIETKLDTNLKEFMPKLEEFITNLKDCFLKTKAYCTKIQIYWQISLPDLTKMCQKLPYPNGESRGKHNSF